MTDKLDSDKELLSRVLL
nr:hypothetical protein [Sicyoidochytrium minutum DNA virus]